MRHLLSVLATLAVAGFAQAQQPRQAPPMPTVDQMIRYLDAVAAAEKLIDAGKLDDARAQLKHALASAPPASRMARNAPKAATARYLMARIQAAQGKTDAAFAALADAAKHRFTDRDRVARELGPVLRKDPRWGKALVAFPPAARYDRLSGKIVKDRRDGMGLIRMRMFNFPKLGEVAPRFVRPTLDGKARFDLAAHRGKRPVVLVFGSYT